MTTHEFSIVASGLDHEADDFETRFFDAGCDDATVSFQKGHIVVDFARKAPSFEEAISSAIADVLKTGAHINRIEPDPLVSLADIAERASMSRSATSLYAAGQRCEGFPAPVARVTSPSPLWEWFSVALWLYKRQKLHPQLVMEAAVVKYANEELVNNRVPSVEDLRQRSSVCVAA